jgi:hypothetical protein
LKVCGSSGKSAVSFSFRVQTSSLTVRDCCGSRTRTRGNRVRCGCHEGGEDLFAEEIAEFDHWSLVWCPS